MSTLPDVSDQQIRDAIDAGMNAMYSHLQDIMGVTDGGVAGMHHSGFEGGDLEKELLTFLREYVSLENSYAPEPEVYEGDDILADRRKVAAEALKSFPLPPNMVVYYASEFQRNLADENEIVSDVCQHGSYETTHRFVVKFAPATTTIVQEMMHPVSAAARDRDIIASMAKS